MLLVAAALWKGVNSRACGALHCAQTSRTPSAPWGKCAYPVTHSVLDLLGTTKGAIYQWLIHRSLFRRSCIRVVTAMHHQFYFPGVCEAEGFRFDRLRQTELAKFSLAIWKSTSWYWWEMSLGRKKDTESSQRHPGTLCPLTVDSGTLTSFLRINLHLAIT